jgi:hypothetical protein
MNKNNKKEILPSLNGYSFALDSSECRNTITKTPSIATEGKCFSLSSST